MTTLTNLKIFHETGIIEKGSVQFDQKIQLISDQITSDGIDLTGCILIPGFIDQHLHGLKGYDVMDSTREALESISKELVREGTTAYYATTLTDSEANILRSLENIRDYVKNPICGYAELLGVHLEGPFLSKKLKGAQDSEYLCHANEELFARFLKASGNTIKHVTLAPETDGATKLTQSLKNQNIVVSIGHSDATYHQALTSIEAGATCFTHGFNAMRGFHHREAGCVGAMLLSGDSYAEIIADGIHVSKESIQLFHRMKSPDRRILVTDSMRAKCLVDGQYKLANLNVMVQNGAARLDDGTLAGSTLKMIQGFQNYKLWTESTIQEMILACSTNPARLHGIEHEKGSIAVAKDADLLILDANFGIVRVYCKGILAYQAK